MNLFNLDSVLIQDSWTNPNNQMKPDWWNLESHEWGLGDTRVGRFRTTAIRETWIFFQNRSKFQSFTDHPKRVQTDEFICI